MLLFVAEVLYTVQANDLDVTSSNNVVRYVIVSDTHGKFAVEPETGIIKLIGSLDREGDRKQYTLMVSAQDNGAPLNSAEQTITIKVSSPSTWVLQSAEISTVLWYLHLL